MASQAGLRDRLAWTARMAWEAPRQARFPFRSEEEIRRVQERRIGAVAVHAGAHVPYYRETFRRLGLEPAAIRTAADLARLPLLERGDVQRDPEYFRSQAWPLNACVLLQSGGSTGEPLTFFRDPASFPAEAAQRERQRSLVTRLAGRRFRYRQASILPVDSSAVDAARAVRGRILVPASVRTQRRLFSIWRPPEELLPELDSYRPDVISSYGSYLEALFGELRATESTIHLPRVVVYGADAMSEAMRSYIRDGLGIEVLGSYNAIETPGVGWECEAHRGYHLNVDLCAVRLVDRGGANSPPGESGDVVISNLVNRGTVLLNYRLGDIAADLPGACPCGRKLPMLSFLQVRSTAWLDLGQGRRLHPQAARMPFRKERHLWRYQVVQEARRSFLIRAVVDPRVEKETTTARLTAALDDSLGGDVAVRVEYVEDLPRDSGGKVQTVIPLSGDPLHDPSSLQAGGGDR